MTTQTKPADVEPEIVIDGTAYPLPNGDFNGHEWAILKRVGGTTAGNLDKARENGDILVIYAFALIAKRRAGQDISDDDILNVKLEKIELKGVDEDTPAESEEDPMAAGDEAGKDEHPGAPAT